MDHPIILRATESGSRLDRYVAERLPALSRALVQRLIDDAQILVDGAVRKASYKVQAGETIIVNIPPPEPATPRAEKILLDILYEDDDLVVINKPAGMVVHPAAGHREGTLVNAILAHCPKLNVGGVERPGIVHRLDRETSGIIVVAKNDAAMRDVQAQFKSRRVHKTYLALVEGIVRPPHGKIDAPIGRDPKHRQKMAVMTRGARREAVTVYRTLGSTDAQSASADLNLVQQHEKVAYKADVETSTNTAINHLPTTHFHVDALLDRRQIHSAARGAYTLLAVEPQTGRTHQIRVHLAFLGFPVVGDAVYGKKKNALGLTRQFLHAWKIAFTLPHGGRAVSFVAPLPVELRKVLSDLGFDFAVLK
jgi:23S rRNA pseudouridine1911/1915/1917 synthase